MDPVAKIRAALLAQSVWTGVIPRDILNLVMVYVTHNLYLYGIRKTKRVYGIIEDCGGKYISEKLGNMYNLRDLSNGEIVMNSNSEFILTNDDKAYNDKKWYDLYTRQTIEIPYLNNMLINAPHELLTFDRISLCYSNGVVYGGRSGATKWVYKIELKKSVPLQQSRYDELFLKVPGIYKINGWMFSDDFSMAQVLYTGAKMTQLRIVFNSGKIIICMAAIPYRRGLICRMEDDSLYYADHRGESYRIPDIEGSIVYIWENKLLMSQGNRTQQYEILF